MLVIVVAVGGFAVARVRGIFGSHQLPTYGAACPTTSTGPTRNVWSTRSSVPLELIADINYIDDDGETNQVDGATLPWSHEIVTTAPSMTGNIVAQTTSAFIGCRITSDGEVKDERTVSQVSAYIYCFVKSA